METKRIMPGLELPQDVRLGLLISLAIALTAGLSRWVSPAESMSLIWLPAGIAFAVVWKYGYRQVPAIALGLAIWALLAYGPDPILVTGAVLADLASSVLGCLVMSAWLKSIGRDSSDPSGGLTRLRWLISFYLAAVLVAAPVAAVIGGTAFLLTGVHDGLSVARLITAYWVIESLAILLVAPTTLVWLGKHAEDVHSIPFSGISRKVSSLRDIRLDGAVLIAVVFLTLALLLLRSDGETTIARALSLCYILAMAFTAMRHGARTTYTTLLLTAFVLGFALILDPALPFSQKTIDSALPDLTFSTIMLILVTTILTQVLQAVSSDRAKAFFSLREQSAHDLSTGLLSEFGFENWLQQAPRGEALLIVSVFFGRRSRINALTRNMPLTELRAAIGAHLREFDAAAAARLEGEHYALVYRDHAASRSLIEHVAQNLRSMRVLDRQGQRMQLYPALAAIRLGPGTRPAIPQLIASLTAVEVPSSDLRSRELIVHEFSPQLEDELHRLAELSACIEQAVRRGTIALFAQPIVPASGSDDRGLAVEVLSRMQDAAGRELRPTDFLPIVEQLGLSRLLDRRITEQVFRWYHDHPEAYGRTRKCAINLTASTLGDPEFPGFVAGLLKKFQLDPHRFCFEITESNAVADSQITSRLITELRALGFRLSVDDFGTGFATFSYLRSFTVDELKIDGSFVESVLRDTVSEEVVRSIVAVARKLGLSTVAEYVSSEAIAEAMTRLGVDHLQGHAVAPARPIDEIYGLSDWRMAGG